MNRACLTKNATLHIQNQHASSIRPIKNNFVRMKNSISYLISFLLLFAFACKSNPQNKDSFKPSFSTYKSDSTGTNSLTEKNEIFYGLLTPVEICTIFNRIGVPSNNAILNPTLNRNKYLSSSKASINTGIYGVDFGYLKIEGIGQEMLDYMVTIREMSNKAWNPRRLSHGTSQKGTERYF